MNFGDLVFRKCVHVSRKNHGTPQAVKAGTIPDVSVKNPGSAPALQHLTTSRFALRFNKLIAQLGHRVATPDS